eukprot:s658_g30.t1
MGKDAAKARCEVPAKRIKGKSKPNEVAAEPKRPPALRKAPSHSSSSKVKVIKKDKGAKGSKVKVADQKEEPKKTREAKPAKTKSKVEEQLRQAAAAAAEAVAKKRQKEEKAKKASKKVTDEKTKKGEKAKGEKAREVSNKTEEKKTSRKKDAQDDKTEDTTKVDKKKKEEERLKFFPVQKKAEAEEIFKTPPSKVAKVSRSPAPSLGTTSSAEAKVKELAAMLEESGDDEETSSDSEMEENEQEEEEQESQEEESQDEDGDGAEESENDSSSQGGNDNEEEEGNQGDQKSEDTEDEAEDDEDEESQEEADTTKETKEEKDTKKVEEKKAEATDNLALVVAQTQDLSQQNAELVRNSTTNKRDWDSFVRSQERFRVHEFYSTNRLEMFGMWLDCDKNWDKLVLKDTWYYMRTSQEFEKKDKVNGITALKGTAFVDDEMLKALTSDEGFMRAGAMPSVTAAPKKRAKPEDKESSKPVEPLNYKDKVISSMQELLNSAAVSRTRSITLKGLDFAEQLAATMLDFANTTETLYSDIQNTIKKDGTTEKEFKVLCRKIEEKASTGKKLKAPLPYLFLISMGMSGANLCLQRSQGLKCIPMATLLCWYGALPIVFPHGYQLAFCCGGSSRCIPVGKQQEDKEGKEMSGWL